jgi:hypothetical protein
VLLLIDGLEVQSSRGFGLHKYERTGSQIPTYLAASHQLISAGFTAGISAWQESFCSLGCLLSLPLSELQVGFEHDACLDMEGS